MPPKHSPLTPIGSAAAKSSWSPKEWLASVGKNASANPKTTILVLLVVAVVALTVIYIVVRFVNPSPPPPPSLSSYSNQGLVINGSGSSGSSDYIVNDLSQPFPRPNLSMHLIRPGDQQQQQPSRVDLDMLPSIYRSHLSPQAKAIEERIQSENENRKRYDNARLHAIPKTLDLGMNDYHKYLLNSESRAYSDRHQGDLTDDRQHEIYGVGSHSYAHPPERERVTISHEQLKNIQTAQLF